MSLNLRFRAESIVAGCLILGAISVSVVFSFVAAKRALTNLEAVLFQAFSLFAGLVGSFLFGRQSAQSAAREMLKPHARSAFRRMFSLYKSISRLAAAIQDASSGPTHSTSSPKQTIEVLRAIVVEQLSTADDALEDWSDIVPEDVAEIRNRTRTISSADPGAAS